MRPKVFSRTSSPRTSSQVPQWGAVPSYMYGNLVAPGPQGTVTAGLGVTTSSGTVTLIPPTDLITKTGEKRVIDGIEYEFLMAPGSEAPSEMMWYLPKFKLINTAEDATHTMHNLYTLRGAKTRDARLWPMYLNQAMQMWGDRYEVQITMHHWPTWGNAEITQLIKVQRDIYKFMHDQTLHYANMGYTMDELPGLVDASAVACKPVGEPRLLRHPEPRRAGSLQLLPGIF